MEQRPVHPRAIAAALDAFISGHCAAPIVDHGNGLEEHEAAIVQWEKFARAHIPGLRFSDRPRFLLVPRDRVWNGSHSTGDTMVNLEGKEADESQWGEIAVQLHRLPWLDEGEMDLVAQDWQYSSIVSAQVRHFEHDEPNPRLYDLNGYMVRQSHSFNSKGVAKRFLSIFETRLTHLFDESPMNERRARVHARLQHHMDLGGNAMAFREYVEGLVDKWTKDVPMIVHRSRRLEITRPEPLKESVLLLRYITEWIALAKERPANVQTFTALLGAANADALRVAMNDAGIVYVPAKGKRRIVAALHAACDHFGKPTPRPKLWPEMLADFIPESTWTAKSVPEARPSYQGTQYRDAYRAVKDRLSE